MSVLSTCSFGIGIIVNLVTGIWLLVLMFRQSIWWGIAGIFLPWLSIIFAILNWQDAKKPFLISLSSLLFFVVPCFFDPAILHAANTTSDTTQSQSQSQSQFQTQSPSRFQPRSHRRPMAGANTLRSMFSQGSDTESDDSEKSDDDQSDNSDDSGNKNSDE